MTSQDIINAVHGNQAAGQAQINRDSTEYRRDMYERYLALATHYHHDKAEHDRYMALAEEIKPVGL